MHTTEYRDTDEPENFDVDDVPECLQKYLITVREPRDIHKSVHHSQDQRLRLLLRRFTNQIQYGCKNSQCTATTCLSYRKRNANGPVRPYTEVAVRTLAIKCVEQYASSGSLDDVFQKSRSRRASLPANARSVSNLELCWNEPVVPWYTHPDDQLKRKHATSKHDGHYQNRTSSKPFVNHPQMEANGRLETSKLSSTHLAEETLSLDAPLNTTKLIKTQRNTHRQFEGDTKAAMAQGPNEPRDETTEHTKDYASGNPTVPKRISQRRKDPASFTQSVFDTHHIRAFDYVQQHSGPASANERGLPKNGTCLAATPNVIFTLPRFTSAHASDTEKVPGERISELRKRNLRMETFHDGVTFRILPASAFVWLKSLVVEHHLDDLGLEQKEYVYTSSEIAKVEPFIRQCISFAFSDPYRLMLSASTWDQYPLPEVGVLEESKITELAEREFESFHAKRTCLIPMWGHIELLCRDIMWLLNMISSRTYMDETYSATYLMGYMTTALQKCGRCPPFAESTPAPVSKYCPNIQVAHLIILVLNITLGIYGSAHEANHFGADLPQHGHGLHNWGPSEAVDIEDSSWASDAALSRISSTIANLISHRAAVDRDRETRSSQSYEPWMEKGILTCIVSILCHPPILSDLASAQLNCSSRLLEVMQAIIYAQWDRKPYIQRTGPVGGALEMLQKMHRHHRTLKLTSDKFELPSIVGVLDENDMPYKWLSYHPDDKTTHILEYSFLFKPMQVVRYFRSLNLQIMKHSYERAMGVYNHGKHQLVRSTWRISGLVEVLDSLRVHMARYFVMTISRANVLEDAIGQIWRRERQELLRPLKVRLGKGEGEEGLDHGGVQQEFFRLVFAEAFNPAYNMFETDSTTHMTWFTPSSLEPLYKFEALGILMGLAIYNGVTLPITMPLVFYMRILGLEVKEIADIEDGWPELAKSFTTMLDWQDGDVGDVIARTYEFTYEAFGKMVSIDMSKTVDQHTDTPKSHKGSKGKERAPSPNGHMQGLGKLSTGSDVDLTNAHLTKRVDGSTSAASDSEEAPLVTNNNRQAFVMDYIIHLTSITIQPQFTAFLRGLHTIVSPRSLSLFTHSPATLKLLIEGHPLAQTLDVDAWFTATTYEDYEPSDATVVWFWEVLKEECTQSQLRKLLEFVTASNRIPINGWKGITFIVQRHGEGDERLPGSSTCYGRLLLPDYSSKEVLKEKLEKAVENSLGFGAL